MTALPHDAPTRLPRRSTKLPARAPKRPAVEPTGTVVTLRPVQHMRRVTFVVLVASLLTVSLMAMLLLNTVLSQGSFRRYELLTQTSELDTREQALSAEVSKLESPAELERRAREQGMVPNQNPAFIDLQTGRVLGQGIPAPDSTVSAEPSSPATATTAGTDAATGTPSGATPDATAGVPGAGLGTADNPLGVGSGGTGGGTANGAQPSPGASSQNGAATSPGTPEDEKPLGLQPAGVR